MSQSRCKACEAKDAIIEFLKEQNTSLQEKLVALVPEAMDNISKLRMTELAMCRPEATDGLLSLDQVTEEDNQFDEWYDSMTRRS